MNTLNPTDQLTLTDLQHFFSATDEYIVKQALEPTITGYQYKRDEYIITHQDGQELIIYKPTIQTLIRHIHQMGWNAGRSGRGTKG